MGGAIDPLRPPLQPRAESRMTNEQYASAIHKLGLSQVRAARFFGFSDSKGQRIALGYIDVPPPIAHLITLMLKHHVKPGDLDPAFK